MHNLKGHKMSESVRYKYEVFIPFKWQLTNKMQKAK